MHKWISGLNMWITSPLTIQRIYEQLEFSTIRKDEVFHIFLLKNDCIIVYDLGIFVKNASKPLKIGVFAVWKNTLLHERQKTNFVEFCP